MAFINKNANLILLFLIVVSVAFLVGATVFYQSSIQRVNHRYNDKVSKLKNVELELGTKIKLLEKVKQDLELKAAREQSFTEKYTDIRSENENLEQTKLSLTSEKESLQKQVSDIQSKLNSLQSDLAYERAKASQLEEEIRELNEDLDDAEEDAAYYREQCVAAGGC